MAVGPRGPTDRFALDGVLPTPTLFGMHALVPALLLGWLVFGATPSVRRRVIVALVVAFFVWFAATAPVEAADAIGGGTGGVGDALLRTAQGLRVFFIEL